MPSKRVASPRMPYEAKEGEILVLRLFGFFFLCLDLFVVAVALQPHQSSLVVVVYACVCVLPCRYTHTHACTCAFSHAVLIGVVECFRLKGLVNREIGKERVLLNLFYGSLSLFCLRCQKKKKRKKAQTPAQNSLASSSKAHGKVRRKVNPPPQLAEKKCIDVSARCYDKSG